MMLGAAKMATNESAYVPAPMGGLNTVDAGGAMPEQDCTYIYNLIAAEQGQRARTGYREWVTGLTGAIDNQVRSTIAFKGSNKDGTSDKLFAVTSTGIWDITSSTDSPPQLVTFGIQTDDAGRGVSCVCATPAGRFLLYCDEENGLHVWSETDVLWTKVQAGTAAQWMASTSYSVGNHVVNAGNSYVCTTAGISNSSGGPTTAGTSISDGTVVWDYVAAATTSTIGPSVADQDAGFDGSPDDFVFVTVFKSRVWLVEKNSSRAWYLDTNAIYGEATSFDFGTKMRAGGPLIGLYNWSYDGGNGLDTLLVGLSGAGDVVIYQGTDPSSASTFGLKGTWSVGSIPEGRKIATEEGGEVLIASALGVVPLSQLVLGKSVEDEGLYATRKISNLFNQLTSTRRNLPGWGLYIHPADNALLVTVPTTSGADTEQLAMSIATKGWSRYRDLPLLSATTLNGELFIGTSDGRVCRCVDYVDNVQLSDPDSYTPVQWSVLTAFRNLGSMRQKQVKMVRPTILSGSSGPIVETTVRYNFNLTEPSEPSGTPLGGWDADLWDSGVWAGEFSPNQTLVGSAGMGRDIALAVRGAASSRTVLVGIDVLFEQGGFL